MLLIDQLLKPGEVELVLTVGPVHWMHYSRLELGDFVVEVSRWILGPWNTSTVMHQGTTDISAGLLLVLQPRALRVTNQHNVE